MNFINQKHKEFYENTLKQVEEFRKTDEYHHAFIYTLGINQVTRRHVNEIFDLLRGEINVNSLSKNWQTGISKKVTELAFNLWNGFPYENFEGNCVSDFYVSNLFNCSYAPYFYEAIKLRFPEYMKNSQDQEDM